MANKAAKIVIKFPINSNLNASHLFEIEFVYEQTKFSSIFFCIVCMNLCSTLKALIVLTPACVSLKWEKIGDLVVD
jgi:hypothetical protein